MRTHKVQCYVMWHAKRHWLSQDASLQAFSVSCNICLESPSAAMQGMKAG